MAAKKTTSKKTAKTPEAKTTAKAPAESKPAPTKAAPAKKAAAKKTPAKKAPVRKKPAKQPKLTPEERYNAVAEAAYYIAEKNEFAGDPSAYWLAAEAQIKKQFGV